MNSVDVITGARLHPGLICGPPGSPARFGGVGLMVRQPGWHLTVTAADQHQIHADSGEIRQKIQGLLPDVCRLTGLTGLSVHVRQELPLHHGLGSGTQLALALTHAALIASGQPRPQNSREAASQLQRSRRSAVGTVGFDHGGFICDSGESPDDQPRTFQQIPLPEHWRIVLLHPSATAGLSGAQEEAVFRQQHWMSDNTVERQITLIHDTILPALVREDFETFRSGLFEYGRIAGEFFAPQQGGVFASEIIHQLTQTSQFGDLRPVQSSWGPSAAVLAESAEQADQLTARLSAAPQASHLTWTVTEPLNLGATLRSAAPEHNYVVRG